jgi:hypothetical protein
MSAQRLVTLLFAGCCLLAVVSMAVSLETTIEGDPDEIVDVNTQSLPLTAEDTDELKDALQSGPASQQGEGGVRQAEGGDEQNPQVGAGSERAPGADADSEGDQEAQQQADSSGDGGDGETNDPADRPEQEPGQSEQAAGEGGSGGDQPAWTQEWLQLLLTLLVLVALAALAYYKREAIAERLRALLGEDEESAATDRLRPPDNEIERQWLAVVSRAEDGDPTATPRERARAVVESGLPQRPVDELTALYESVRYGDRPVTARAIDEASSYAQASVGDGDE